MPEPHWLTEEEAHRLLARAAEIEARDERDITVDQLRAAALEAGIGAEAFDRALCDLRAAPAERGLIAWLRRDYARWTLFSRRAKWIESDRRSVRIVGSLLAAGMVTPGDMVFSMLLVAPVFYVIFGLLGPNGRLWRGKGGSGGVQGNSNRVRRPSAQSEGSARGDASPRIRTLVQLRPAVRLLALVALVTTAGLTACGGASDSPTQPSGGGTKTSPDTTTTTTSGVASVTISGTDTVQAGATTQLTAVAKDASGAVMSVPITWSSSSPTLISVGASSGLVTAAHIASATITATAGGKTGTTVVTSALTPFTFNFDPTMLASDQQTVKDAVQFAQGFYLTYFGRNVQSPTTINGSVTAAGCQQSGDAAFTGAGSMTLCIQQPGWTNFGPVMKAKITIHETFHLIQFEMHWLGGPNPGPTWMVEGSAELMGFRGIAAEGLLSFATGEGCQVKESSDFASRTPPGLPPLQQLETQQEWHTVMGPSYTEAMLGMDYLTSNTPNVGASLKAYGEALATGVPFSTAMNTAFGMNSTTFYTNFPPYLASLPVPPNYLCGV